MIPQRNLSLLSNRLAKDHGRRLPEAILERDYCLAWFLVALSRSPLREALAFKGGTVLRRCYLPDYRFSEDLDFTMTSAMPFETIRLSLDEVFVEAQRASGIRFAYSRSSSHHHINSHTFYLSYQGPLPPTQSAKEVKVDITINERIVFDLEDREILAGYQEYNDLPKAATIRAYSLNEIAAEKVLAMMDRARNEPRDLYDVWYLSTDGLVDIGNLREAIEQKLNFRQKQMADVREEFRAKEKRYRALWASRLGNQMVELPDFEDVYRAVQRHLRQAGLFDQ